MLIELHESIAEAAPDRIHRDALEALGRCDAHGYHQVVAMPGLTRRIVQRHSPTGLARRAFNRVEAEELGWLPLQNILPVSLRVEVGIQDPAWTGAPSSSILRVPLHYCAQVGYEHPSVLIGENFNDTNLFVVMGRHLLRVTA